MGKRTKKRKHRSKKQKIQHLTRKNISLLFDFMPSALSLEKRLKMDFLSKKSKRSKRSKRKTKKHR